MIKIVINLKKMDDEIQILKYIESHQLEIHQLKQQCKTKLCKNNAQRLPRHMRRRAASNNPKRLPKSLREFVSKNDLINNSKRKRRHKRRNVFRRNQDPRRTPLHIWFAKRFQMIFKHDKFLPYRNHMKNQRILYRNYSLNGYVVFYLPCFKSFVINDPDWIEHFSAFCGTGDLKRLQDLKLKLLQNSNDFASSPTLIHLYQYKQYPLKLIGPCWITILNECSLYLHGHELVFEFLKQQFQKHFSTIHFKQLTCSHVRVCGRQSLKRVNRKILNFDYKINDNDEQFKCFCLNSDSAKQIQFDEFILNEQLSNTIAMRQYQLGQIQVLDLVISDPTLKTIWNKLNNNMSHLVGGQADLQVLTINIDHGAILFPDIGFLDSLVNSSSSDLQIFMSNDQNQSKYIIRDEYLIKESWNWIITKHSQPNPVPANALLMVQIEYLNGTPKTNDRIMAPNVNDNNLIILSNYLNNPGKYHLHQFQEIECLEMVQKQQQEQEDNLNKLVEIGIIEYGCYSMRHAKCMAMAVVCVDGLGRLAIMAQENLNQQNQDFIYGLVKCQQQHFRLVKISILNTNNCL